jgi:excisionase family DNA binding protein
MANKSSVKGQSSAPSAVPVSRAAKALGYSSVTIRKALESKEIPGVRIGNDWRVSKSWLDSEVAKLEVAR